MVRALGLYPSGSWFESRRAHQLFGSLLGMPTYDYKCGKCKKVIEVVHRITEEPKLLHEHCGGELFRCIGIIHVAYKGEGWARKK